MLTERERAYQRSWYHKNRAKRMVNNQKWASENREYNLARKRAYYLFNKNAIRAKNREGRERLKDEMFTALGNKCSCCGESIREFLTLEHLDGAGASYRRGVNGKPTVRSSGVWYYEKKQGWPKDRLTILCWNCNCSKSRSSDNICPHKKIKIAEMVLCA